jgi:hypothetical protein
MSISVYFGDDWMRSEFGDELLIPLDDVIKQLTAALAEIPQPARKFAALKVSAFGDYASAHVEVVWPVKWPSK